MFCGDGEMMSQSNLIFVLDGPVRGNSRIITELGAIFKAAGWNVVNAYLG